MDSYKLINETFVKNDFIIEYTDRKGKVKRLIRTKMGKKLKFSLHGNKIEFFNVGEIVNV